MPIHHKAKLPTEYLAAIGSVVASWNDLEFELNMLLIHLLGKETVEPRSHVAFAHMSFPQRLDVLGALAQEVSDDPKYAHAKNCADSLLPLLKQAQKIRNQIIHSDWGIKNGKVSRVSISARGTFKFSGIPVKLEEIEKATITIEKARDTIHSLIDPFVRADILRWSRRHKRGKT